MKILESNSITEECLFNGAKMFILPPNDTYKIGDTITFTHEKEFYAIHNDEGFGPCGCTVFRYIATIINIETIVISQYELDLHSSGLLGVWSKSTEDFKKWVKQQYDCDEISLYTVQPK